MYFKQGAVIERSNTTATSGGTLTLVNTSATYQYFTGSTTHTLKLPDATTLKQGMRWEVINNSTGAITVQDGSGATIGTVSSTSTIIFRCLSNGSTAGSWDVTTASAGGGGAGSLSSSDSAAFAAAASQTFTLASKPIKFNPEEISGNFWTTKSSLPNAKSVGGTISLNGYLYATGGSTGATTTENVRYSDDLNFWLTKNTIPTAKHYSAVFNLNGVAYNVGGATTGNIGSTSGFTTDSQKYVDSTDTWSALSNAIPVTTYQGAGFYANGYGYLQGGYNGSTQINTTYRYNDTLGTWSARANASVIRDAHASFTLNNVPYICMGFNGSSLLAYAEKYSDHTNTWSTTNSATTSRDFVGGFAAVGFGFVSGGYNGSTQVNLLDQYSDTTNSWLAKATQVNNLEGQFANSINGFGHSVGGWNGSSVFSANERYQTSSIFKTNIISKSSAVPNSIAAAVLLNGITQSLPVQVRTDGDNWKTFAANGGSPTKTGETLANKFQPAAQVYFAGGTTNRSGSGAVTTTELYNVQQNSWSTRQGLAAAAYGLGGMNIGGTGYAIGGLNSSDVAIATNSAYNEITNAYTSKAAYPTGNQYPGVGALNGYGYMTGSSNSTGNSTLQNQQYNPTLDSWTSKTAQINDVYQTTMINVNGFLWQVGGRSSGGTTGQNYNQQYSDVTNAWANKTALNTGVNVAAGFALNGTLYIAGGMNTAQNAISTTQSYNTQNNAWTNESGTTSSAVMFCTGVASQGFGYVEGGSTGTGTNISFFSQFNPAASVWVDKANQGQRQVTANGFSSGAYYSYEMRVLLPASYLGLGNTSTWVAKANMVRVQAFDCNFMIGDQFYGSMGLDGGIVDTSGRTNVTQRYNSVIDAWSFDVPNSMGIGDTGGHSTGNTLGGMGYAMGYNASTGGLNPTCVKYVPDIRSWAAVANMLINSGAGNFNAPLNGYMYNNGNHPSTGSARMDQYAPSTNSWVNKTSSTTNHYGGAGASNGGFFYSMSDSSATTSVERFNDSANSWTTMAALPTGVQGSNGALNVKDRFQSVGGYPATNVVQEYNPFNNTWQQKTVLPINAYDPLGGTLNTGTNIVAGGNNGSYIATCYAQVPNIKNAVLSAALTIS